MGSGLLAGAIGVVVIAVLYVGRAYRHAARVERRAAAGCAFERNEPLPGRARVASALGEAVLLLRDALLPLGPPRTPLGPAGARVVLLCVGGTRGASPRALARRLATLGCRVHVVALGRVATPVDDRVAALRTALDRTAARVVDVVAYDADGLAARALLRLGGTTGRVRRLVTLGTPHQGTSPWPRGPAELAPGSTLLDQLARDDRVPESVEAIAIYSADEARVVPCANGYWRGAFNVEIRGIGHRALLVSPRVHELVAEALELGPEATRPAATERPR